MEINVFGKPGCEFCKTTMKKFETFLARWKIDPAQVSLKFHDMETVDGLAEGAYYSVIKIPSTVIRKNGELLARWDGKVPLSQEFKDLFSDFVPIEPARNASHSEAGGGPKDKSEIN